MISFNSYELDHQKVLVVELSGRLDTESADRFFAHLETAIRQGHKQLIVDCKALDHISSLGLGMMIRAHSRLKSIDGAVRFARLEGYIEEAFRVVGFDKLFDNFSSVEEAAESMAA